MNKNEITIESIYKGLNEYLKSAECKNELKKSIIDFLVNDEEFGHMELDNTVKSLLNEQDWKEIAKAVGEDITVVGNLVFTREGIARSDQWNFYKA